jgi:hypothetical protein
LRDKTSEILKPQMENTKTIFRFRALRHEIRDGLEKTKAAPTSEQYYDKKMQDFFELKLENMAMDEYERKLLELLRYVGFIRDDKVKIQRFLSGLPYFYNDNIQFDKPKNLEKAIRKAKYLYEQNRGNLAFQRAWDDKKK